MCNSDLVAGSSFGKESKILSKAGFWSSQTCTYTNRQTGCCGLENLLWQLLQLEMLTARDIFTQDKINMAACTSTCSNTNLHVL